MNKTIIAVIITLVIAGGAGYMMGSGTKSNDTSAKELGESIAMMKQQSLSIKQMSDMMKSGGLMLQELGTKYKDDTIVGQGKDMIIVAEKYMKENSEAKTSSGSMQKVMGE